MVMMKPIVSSSYWNVNSMQSMGNDLRMLKMFLSFLMTSLSWCDRNDNKRQAVLQLDQTFFFRPTSWYCYSLRISSFKLVTRILWRIFVFFFCTSKALKQRRSCFRVVDDAKWKRKSCQHTSMIRDSWFMIDFVWFYSPACLSSMLLLFLLLFFMFHFGFYLNNFWHIFRFRSRTN